MKRIAGIIAFSALVGLCVNAAPAQAEFGYMGWGVRGGLSVDPDQFFFGAHGQFEFLENFYFMPNATLGLGNDLTIFALTPDLIYAFPVEDIGQLYTGGILSIQFWKFDEPAGLPENSTFDDTQTEIGIHVLGGLALESVPVFFEANIGLDDAPDLKLAVGYTFFSE
jgi:hypothetical protein